MDYFIDYFQPSISRGEHKLNLTNFDISRKQQLAPRTNPIHRSIYEGSYLRGYRANVGTVITGRRSDETKECIQQLHTSKNTDYTNVLDGLDVPTNLKSALSREKLLTGNLRYLLFTLKVLPVSYSVSEVSNIPANIHRMAEAFAKTSPYLLDPSTDSVVVPQKLRPMYLEAVQRFNKNNSAEVEEYMEDSKLLR